MQQCPDLNQTSFLNAILANWSLPFNHNFFSTCTHSFHSSSVVVLHAERATKQQPVKWLAVCMPLVSCSIINDKTGCLQDEAHLDFVIPSLCLLKLHLSKTSEHPIKQFSYFCWNVYQSIYTAVVVLPRPSLCTFLLLFKTKFIWTDLAWAWTDFKCVSLLSSTGTNADVVCMHCCHLCL